MCEAALVIQGLGGAPGFPVLIRRWRERHGIEAIHHRALWHDTGAFEEKLAHLIERIDAIPDDTRVSLVGCSAGAGLALNAFLERRDRVHRVVSVCGWLRVGESRAYLERCRRVSNAFVESVLHFDEHAEELSMEDRTRVLLVLPRFDQVVPRESMALPGAAVAVLPAFEHTMGIGMALTTHARPVVEFLRSESEVAQPVFSL